jgi:hypothetical protein
MAITTRKLVRGKLTPGKPVMVLPSLMGGRLTKYGQYTISLTPWHRFLSFPSAPFCVTLASMGSKDKGKKEVKKAPKPKPKPEPGRKREGFTPAPPK